MIIQKLNYKEIDTEGNEWSLNDFSFGKINLVVGKNSTGKTRTLNIIASLGAVFAGERRISHGHYDVEFSSGSKKIKYSLKVNKGLITEETLCIDENKLLDRGKDGAGLIYAEELKQEIKFQVPNDISACVARRDSIQHPFFEDLYKWGESLRHFYFGTQLGKDRFAVFVNGDKSKDLNCKDTDKVVAFFKKGVKEIGDSFADSVLSDINGIGYDFSELGIATVNSIILEEERGVTTLSPNGLYLKEKSHSHQVDQREMSQGLFRALSLFIQLRYSEKFSIPSLVLIDDIGEGLDYDRSTSLIKSIIEITKKTDTQLVMSTNDRFVMNNVPLEYWCILNRSGVNKGS